MKQLIPIPIPKEQILEQLKSDMDNLIGDMIKAEKFKIEIDHMEWTMEGITVYAKLPRRSYNKK
jgi:hypothetical protein